MHIFQPCDYSSVICPRRRHCMILSRGMFLTQIVWSCVRGGVKASRDRMLYFMFFSHCCRLLFLLLRGLLDKPFGQVWITWNHRRFGSSSCGAKIGPQRASPVLLFVHGSGANGLSIEPKGLRIILERCRPDTRIRAVSHGRSRSRRGSRGHHV